MSFSDYVAHGWKLCSIDRGHKAPLYAGWNTPESSAAIGEAADGLDGAGLLHALSGTCAIDIDDMGLARPWLAERGIDVDELLDAPEAVRIDSGRPSRAKLLYRMARPLRTLKPDGSGVELRCATAAGKSMQDVLPPTIHPDTQRPYAWKYGEPLTGHWSELPTIPAALLALWREMIPTVTAAPEAPHSVELDELRKLIAHKSPNCGYNEWIKIGMALHDGTGGAEEGLALWNEWSARAPDRYKGPDDLLVHWRSFASAPGKHIVTVNSLKAESRAEADEFDIIEAVPQGAPPDTDNTAAQLQQAAEMKKAEAFAWLEKRLVYVRRSGCYFDTDHHHLIRTDRGIQHEFTPFMPKTKAGRYDPVKALMESRTKKIVTGVAFHPGEGPIFRSAEGDEYANVYHNRLPEPIEPSPAERAKIEWLFDRVDDADYRDWLVQFFSYAVQHPGVKIKAAPLIWSDTEGNGKTTLLRVIPALLVSPSYSREVTTSLLNSDFNDYLLNAWHVNLTEFRADSRGERRIISAKLKAWITDDIIALHPKGGTAYDMPNHFFVTATSNENDAASIGNQDRRWAVHEMHAKQFTLAEQRWAYDEFLSTRRAAAVLRHYFLHVDTTNFSPSAKAPETEARNEMVRASMPGDLSYMIRAFEERSGPFERDVVRTADVAESIRRETRVAPSLERVARLMISKPILAKARKAKVGKGTVNFMIVADHARWQAASGPELAAEAVGETIDITR